MMWTLSKSFGFEAAHTLHRDVAAEASRRVHGHSYRAEIALRGKPDASGMLIDLGLLAAQLDRVQSDLDHRMLDDIPGLGAPTLENLARFIFRTLRPALPPLWQVTVFRDSLQESCAFREENS
jgi:6-pyruvoyltetrahydropterin/6-carboxytetrahydropterin synthase